MATLNDLGTEALRDLGVLAVSQTPDADQSAQILSAANGLVDFWKTRNVLTYTITRNASTTLTASTTSFTVGTGGNVNIPRPVFIERVAVLDTNITPNVEYDLGRLLTDQEFSKIPVKSLTSTLPTRAYYDPTYPTGTLYPLPIPTNSGLKWVVYYYAQVAEFAAISDVIALPPGYRRMIVKNLAVELGPKFMREVSPALLKAASESRAWVERANMKPVELGFDPGAVVQGGTYYNWRLGQ